MPGGNINGRGHFHDCHKLVKQYGLIKPAVGVQLLEDRYRKKSIILTSQLPVSKWYECNLDPTPSDAIMDRMTANGIRIELKGK